MSNRIECRVNSNSILLLDAIADDVEAGINLPQIVALPDDGQQWPKAVMFRQPVRVSFERRCPGDPDEDSFNFQWCPGQCAYYRKQTLGIEYPEDWRGCGMCLEEPECMTCGPFDCPCEGSGGVSLVTECRNCISKATGKPCGFSGLDLYGSPIDCDCLQGEVLITALATRIVRLADVEWSKLPEEHEVYHRTAFERSRWSHLPRLAEWVINPDLKGRLQHCEYAVVLLRGTWNHATS